VAPSKRITRESVLAKVAAAFGGDAAPSMDEMVAAAGVSRAALYELFGNRAGLLEAIGAEVPPSVADRILAAAGELVAERGLGGLSLDEVASRSGASRATVYRFYPGKAALFRAVVLAYLPIDETLGMMETMADSPPTQVMGTLARSLAQTGSVRIGVLRSVLFEIGRREDETEEVLDEVVRSTQVIIGYLEQQMAAGRLRRMDPVLAMQAFLAPIMLHMVSRPLVVEEYGLTAIPLDEAVQEFTDAWLRAMAPPRRRYS
jgi:AcrR family transcriptional regulator